jgi:flavin-binding protein dodecin
MASIVKVIEVIAESDQSWEQAAQSALEHASRTVRNIKSIYVDHLQGVVENNRITQFRLNAKISFVIEEGDQAG